ncbi:hypothetical protein MKX03_029135 [Papaver bracteatum]|nr:hypothetical protein MKX03_029135 [Papaver bracteatum]
MNLSLPLLSMSSIFVVFLVLNSFGHTANGELISDVCKNASRSDPQIKYDFFLLHLFQQTLQVKILMICWNLESYQCNIYGKEVPITKPCLEDCLDLYSDALDSIPKAMQYFKDKDYSSANIAMSAAMDASVTCEDGFKEGVCQHLISPLSKQDGEFFQLTAISLTITNMI